MSSRTFPILVWPSADGFGAALVGDLETASAAGATESEVLRQLKDLLEWRLEDQPWNADPDLLEPALIEVKVEIRPRYASRRRVIPSPDPVWIRVPCVVGHQESGLGLCAVPHLGVQFNFHDRNTVKDLVGHYVKESLQGLSPAELLMQRPPGDCRLTEVTVRIPGERPGRLPPEDRPELKLLFSVADPLLKDFGRKRTASAAYGREALAGFVADRLASGQANVLLVGETGSGKTTVLLEAVKRLVRKTAGAKDTDPDDDDSGPDLRRYRHWRSSGGRLIAGMRYLGQWEERCEGFIAQLGAIDGVFCAENLLELVSVGGQGPGDSVAAFLLPYLQRGELRMVAECTPAEAEACRRLLPGFLESFQRVPVPELNDAEAVSVLGAIASSQAATTKVEIEPGAIALVHRLFKRFQPYAAFPGPAAGFVRALCPARRTAETPAVTSPSGSVGGRQLTKDEVVRAFVARTGLPELFLRDEIPLAVAEVEARFSSKIIGQPDSTRVAARLMATIKAGLTDPGRPPGVLLFCGPTGVGKTALARLLAEFCFGAGPGSGSGRSEERLIRLDMSEYAGWDAARRLLEKADGQSAAWIDRVRRQPFCVVLFDEIEKAAPEVFDVLLSLLDEGRMTDRFGRVTWFRSAIVILTSNLGASATDPAGFKAAESGAVESGYASAVLKFFRPEFFNRLDGVVTFRPLDRSQVEQIVRKELEDLAEREGLAAAGLRLQWTDRLVAAVAVAGYDHRLGARPLQRALERLVVTPLAHWKVSHPAVRDQTLRLDWAEGTVILGGS